MNPHSGTAQVSYVRIPSGSQAPSESQGGEHRDLGKTFSGDSGSGAVLTGTPLGSSHGPVSVSSSFLNEIPQGQAKKVLLNSFQLNGHTLGLHPQT